MRVRYSNLQSIIFRLLSMVINSDTSNLTSSPFPPLHFSISSPSFSPLFLSVSLRFSPCLSLSLPVFAFPGGRGGYSGVCDGACRGRDEDDDHVLARHHTHGVALPGCGSAREECRNQASKATLRPQHQVHSCELKGFIRRN